MKFIPFILFSLFSIPIFATTVLSQLPEQINPNQHYVFYSHGFIVEGNNPTPTHPRWGLYDFPVKVEAIASLGVIVIAEQRPTGTDPFSHARKLQKQVETLLKAGVPAKHITLIGFSRGGFITAIASDYLANTNLNYVILAACTSGLGKNENIRLYGHILSVYETSDNVGSCQKVKARSHNAISSFSEHAISTGKEHGAFYKPYDQWMEILNKWLHRNRSLGSYTLPRSQVIELIDPNSSRVYRVTIQLPRSHTGKPDKQYPTIYLTDAPYTFPIVAGATRFPVNTGTMPEAIIVAIGYARDDRGPASRVRDYTPVKDNDWKLETGGASTHLHFIKNTVIPYVETNFGASGGKRTYIGNSLGGLFGAYVLFTAPDTFDSYVLGSPSVWYKDEHLLSVEPVQPEKHINVYISVGSLENPENGESQDMTQGARQLTDKINAPGYRNTITKLAVIPNATHATAFPTTAIQGLDWLNKN